MIQAKILETTYQVIVVNLKERTFRVRKNDVENILIYNLKLDRLSLSCFKFTVRSIKINSDPTLKPTNREKILKDKALCKIYFRKLNIRNS